MPAHAAIALKLGSFFLSNSSKEQELSYTDDVLLTSTFFCCHRQKWSAVASTNLVGNSVTRALSLKYSPVHRGGETETETSQWAGLPLLPIMCKSPVRGQEVTGSGVTSSGTATLNLLWSTQAFTGNIYGLGFIWGCLVKLHSNPPTLSSRNFSSLLTAQTLFPLSAQQVVELLFQHKRDRRKPSKST